MKPFGTAVAALPGTSVAAFITSRFQRFPGTRYSGEIKQPLALMQAVIVTLQLASTILDQTCLPTVYRHNLHGPLALTGLLPIFIEYPLHIYDTTLQKVVRKIQKNAVILSILPSAHTRLMPSADRRLNSGKTIKLSSFQGTPRVLGKVLFSTIAWQNSFPLLRRIMSIVTG